MASLLYSIKLFDTQTLNSAGVLTSGIIDLRRGDAEFLMFRITQAGAADARIGYRISNDGVTFNLVTSQAALVASTNTAFASPLNPKDYHSINTPIEAPWIMIVVTELASLNTNIVDATLWCRELH